MTDKDTPNLESQVRELREWVQALARRVDELEATAFQLEEEEEVLVIALPKEK